MYIYDIIFNISCEIVINVHNLVVSTLINTFHFKLAPQLIGKESHLGALRSN